MAITSSDIKFRLSGGASNSDVNASIGGAESSTEIVDASLHNLFDIVSSAEGSAGDTEYRCFYVHNAHATLTLQSAKIYIQTQTPDSDTSVEIGLGASAVNGTEAAIANEGDAPDDVTFSTADGAGNALSIGDIPAGEHKAIWVKRIVSADAAAYNGDSVILRVAGDTAA
jgi:hypothetical protein